MRVSSVIIELSVADINELIEELAPTAPVRVQYIDENGIHAQVKLGWFHVDVNARPAAIDGTDVTLDVSVHKFIPSGIISWQLREAIKDAPPGISVIEQSLRVHLPSILGPFGLDLRVKEFGTRSGYLRIVAERLKLPVLSGLLGGEGLKSSGVVEAKAPEKPVVKERVEGSGSGGVQLGGGKAATSGSVTPTQGTQATEGTDGGAKTVAPGNEPSPSSAPSPVATPMGTASTSSAATTAARSEESAGSADKIIPDRESQPHADATVDAVEAPVANTIERAVGENSAG